MRRPFSPLSVVALLALLVAGSPASAQIIPWSEPPLVSGTGVPPVSPRVTGVSPVKSSAPAAPQEIPASLPTRVSTFSLWDLFTPPATLILSSFDSTVGAGSVRPTSSWVGQVTQNTGSITVAGNAGDDNGWGATGLSLDATGMTFLAITAQRNVGNLAPSVFIQLEDRALRTQVFSVSTSQFALGVPTVVHIPITAWTLNFGVNDITGWSVGGGSVGTVPFRLTFDELAFTTSAIPEPTTYAALLGALSLAVAWRRRVGAVAYRRRALRQ